VTAALVELAPESGALTFVGAGHLDNVIVRADGSTVPLSSTGAPLGLLGPGLPYTETLGPGDALVLYSDGITDAQDASSKEFGDHGCSRSCGRRPASLPKPSSAGSSTPSIASCRALHSSTT
jgi:phosphoserine phosphatase RsbU/P